MRISRRQLFKAGALGAAVLSTNPGVLFAAEKARPARMRLGTVTYNLAKDWDIPTIIKNCEAAKFEGVELRTSHAHKVEVNLSKEERTAVKKRFADSKVE